MFQLLHRIRRNHALEHATINLLSQRYPNAQIVGMSGPSGFTLYTSLTMEDVAPVVKQALQRLQNGEGNLRIHQQCGTNLVVTATLTTLASLIGLSGGRAGNAQDRASKLHLERLPPIILLNALALLVASPLAIWVQANLTTANDMKNVEITSIFTHPQSAVSQHTTSNQMRIQRIGIHTQQAV